MKNTKEIMIFIPFDIWRDKDLTLSEKVFLSEIKRRQDDGGCFTSNKEFGQYMNLTKGRITQLVTALVKKNKVKLKFSETNGRQKREIIITKKECE